MTVVNRNSLESQAVEMVLRDASFAGSARVRSLTDDRAAPTGHETLAGNVQLEDVSQQTGGSATVFHLPPCSFAVFEGPIEMEH